MRILVDMDDVLEQLVAGWVAYINHKFGTDTKAEDVKDWDISLAFPTLTKEQVYCPEFDDDFWDWVKPMPGADEALRKLIADGHEIIVVTASYYQTLKAKMDRVLFRYFPYLNFEKNVIITFNKQLIDGDVLIDDGPHNLTGGRYRKILFDTNHNRKFDEASVGAVRAHNWNEVYDIICRFNKEKKNSG